MKTYQGLLDKKNKEIDLLKEEIEQYKAGMRIWMDAAGDLCNKLKKYEMQAHTICVIDNNTDDNGFVNYDAPLDLSAANDAELELCRIDMLKNGIPKTPARWQRKFKWSYCKSQSAMMQLNTLEMLLTDDEIPCEKVSWRF